MAPSAAAFDCGVVDQTTLFSGTRVGCHGVVNTADKLNWYQRDVVVLFILTLKTF